MSQDELVTIAVYGNPHEASIANNALEAQGISGHLSGEEIANSLFNLGTALGGVKLQVEVEDSERAAALLETLQTSDQSVVLTAWTCPQCGASVDEGFEICWSCGKPFDPASPEPGTSQLISPSLEEEATDAQLGSAAGIIAASAWVIAILLLSLLLFGVNALLGI